MHIKHIALAVALAASGLVGGQALAQTERVVVTQPSHDGGVMTKKVTRSADGSVRKTVRVNHPDGSTTVRHATRVTNPDGSTSVRRVTRHAVTKPVNRTVVVRNAVPQQHVVIRDAHSRPTTVVNKRVTVIHKQG